MEEPAGKYKCRRCGTFWTREQVLPPPPWKGAKTCGDAFCGATVEYVPPAAGQQVRHALEQLRFHEGMQFTTDFVTRPETGEKLSVTLFTNSFTGGLALVDYPGGGCTVYRELTAEVYPHRVLAELRARMTPVLVTGEREVDEAALYSKLAAALGHEGVAAGGVPPPRASMTAEEALAILRAEITYATELLGTPAHINGRTPAAHLALCAELFGQIDARVKGQAHP